MARSFWSSIYLVKAKRDQAFKRVSFTLRVLRIAKKLTLIEKNLPMVANFNRHRLSAVSSIIRQMEAEKEIAVKPSIDLKFVIANNLFHRLNAFHLGYNEYLKKGYIHENQYGVLMNALRTLRPRSGLSLRSCRKTSASG